MLNLLYKELRLAAHPTLFIFALLGVLVIVPAYPYGMVFMFGCLGVFNTSSTARTNDIFYSALLPIPKRDVVKGNPDDCVGPASADAYFPSLSLLAGESPAPGNTCDRGQCCLLWFRLCDYAIFNFLFLTSFFKSGYKAGNALLLASIPAVLVLAAMEVLVHFPAFAWLDSVASRSCAPAADFGHRGGSVYRCSAGCLPYLSAALSKGGSLALRLTWPL